MNNVSLDDKINYIYELVKNTRDINKGTVIAIIDKTNKNYIGTGLKAKSIFIVNDSDTDLVYVKIKDRGIQFSFTIPHNEYFEENFSEVSDIEIYATDFYRSIIRG